MLAENPDLGRIGTKDTQIRKGLIFDINLKSHVAAIIIGIETSEVSPFYLYIGIARESTVYLILFVYCLT